MKSLVAQLDEGLVVLERNQADLSSITAKIADKTTILSDLEQSIADKQRDLSDIEQAYRSKVEAEEDKLKLLYVKLDAALTRLRDTEKQAENTRVETAERLLAVSKREEVVARKEKLFRNAEAQAAELQRYMKL